MKTVELGPDAQADFVDSPVSGAGVDLFRHFGDEFITLTQSEALKLAEAIQETWSQAVLGEEVQ